MSLVLLSIQLPCLLVGVFKPFTFKMIMDKYAFSAVLLIDYFLLLFFFLSLFLLKASLLTFVAVLVWC